MRWYLSILCCLCVLGHQSSGQDATTIESAKSGPRGEAPLIVYQVDVIEFAVKDKADADLESAKLLDLLKTKSDRVQRIEVIRMTAISGVNCTASFTRSANITMGVTKSVAGSTRNTTQVPIGTTVELVPSSNADGTAIVALRYEAARLKEAKQEDATPDIDKVTIDATLRLKLGTPTLVAGSTNGDSSYIAITIREER